MKHHASVVRRGNHFIHVKPEGWLLIDGPWFKRLEGMAGSWHKVRVATYRPMDFSLVPPGWCDPCDESEEPATWERVWYQPSEFRPTSFLHNDRFASYLLARVPARSDPRNYLIGYLQSRLRQKWRKRLINNLQYGWRLSPDGRIPAYFHWQDWIEDEYEAEGYEKI